MDSTAPRGPDRRKEWRAVPQEPDHGKHGQSDERTIYEEGAGPLQVDYYSITVDGGHDMLRERLQDIAPQQQELLCRWNQPGSRPGGRIRRGGNGCETSTGFDSSERSFGVRHATLGQCASCWEQACRNFCWRGSEGL